MDILRDFKEHIDQNLFAKILYLLIVVPSVILFFVSILVSFQHSGEHIFLLRMLCGWGLTILVFSITSLISNENILLIVNLIFASAMGDLLWEYEVAYFPEDNASGFNMLVFFMSAYFSLIPSYKISVKLREFIEKKQLQYTMLNQDSRKRSNKLLILMFITIVAIISAAVAYEYPYLAYENTLGQLQSNIEAINYNKYAESNDWIFDLHLRKAEYECESFKYSYNEGDTLAQNNELSYYGTCTNNFENWSDKSKAISMCSVLTNIMDEADTIYIGSSYYEKFGKHLDAGETIKYRNDVTINEFSTTYRLKIGTLDHDFYLNLDRDGNGEFTSKKYINDQEYYYNYNVAYENGKLTYFKLNNYSTPKESGHYDKKTEKMKVFSKSNGVDADTDSNNATTYRTPRKTDSYNSSRYKDADSFADDYYEEFYDYGDYEDDEDAYDAAVDYWNDLNN